MGCAASTPNGDGDASGRKAVQPSDSARQPPVSEVRPASRGREGAPSPTLRAAYVNGRYKAVVQRARKRLRDTLQAGESVRLYTLLGRAEQALGRHKEAIKALREARAKAFAAGQSVVHLDRALGESYAALYRWSQAALAFQRVLEAQPANQASRQALAEVYRRSRDWKEAKQQYSWLVRRDSSNGRWWARLAKCEIELGKIGQAISHFATAHRLLPQSAEVALTLSRFYRDTMRPRAARRVIDTTLAYRPGDPRLWRRRADLAYEQGALKTARRAYNRAIARGDSSATVYRRMGLIDVKRQQHARALSSLRASYRRDSTHSRTTLYLGISYLNVDSLQRATTYLQRTIKLEAQGPITEAFVQRGAVNDRRGNVSAAVRAYRTALRLRPDRTSVYFRLATVYDEYYREKATAARYYRRFLRTSDSTRERLRTYAKDRLETLRTTLHMQEGVSQSDSAP